MKFTHPDNFEDRQFIDNYFKNQIEIANELVKPTMFYINKVEGILGDSQSFYGKILLNMARKWISTNINEYQNNDNFILVLGSSQPQNINEILLQKMKFKTIFVQFLGFRNIKQIMVTELQKAEKSFQQYEEEQLKMQSKEK